ncbi:trypsin-like peptidase domain-containing protein [Sodalis sp. RH16]|uniref:trypsin-like peptidase domain-containing protein n=1 Tax=Sodalis sp. RH16 TaxID=3394331 RepID=UPI0039B6CCC1
MSYYLMIAVISVTLAACSAVGQYHVDEQAQQKADLHFIGIPVLAGAVGSSFPITENYSLTAGHVARIMMLEVKAYNPLCDVALIYQDNHGKSIPQLAPATTGEHVKMYGYNAYTIEPTSSSGAIAAFGWWDKPKQSCYVALSSAGGIQGMSGGPVYADNGKVVGIFTATHPERNQTIFVPYQEISNWLSMETRS